MNLIADTEELLAQNGDVASVLGIVPRKFDGFAHLAGAVLSAATHIAPDLIQRVYAENPTLAEMSQHDIAETARRNFEPGGAAATLLFARGAHAVMAYRVAHELWQTGERTLASAFMSKAGRVLSIDIHPAARIGRGFWLDHGLGFVMGETAVIGKNVSIWHNVTLGSTLTNSGSQRHPTIENNAVIGAGATLLGRITIGAGANVAAGSLVLEDVAPGTVVAGRKAKRIGLARVSFAPQTETN